MAWTNSGYAPEACGDSVLLLGNGLNWASEGPSWSDLLFELARLTGFTGELDAAIPFPLLYEEMYLHGLRRGMAESELLTVVAEHSMGIRQTPLVSRLYDLPATHLLTTNYDPATERAFLGANGKPTAPVRERRYSVFRRREHQGRVVWPIHGEARRVGSIMLGYEHYSGYLEQIRRYVTRGVTYQGASQQSLAKALSSARGLDLVRSWIDFFFTKRIVILGLTLDVQELHLWWLLTYRARRRAEGKRYASDGTIVFVHGPAPDSSMLHEPAAAARLQRTLRTRRLLRAAGVELKEVSAGSPADRTAFFDAALDAVEQALIP